MSSRKDASKKDLKLEEFRAQLVSRIIQDWGDVGDVADAAGVHRQTASRWQNEGYSLPDAFQLLKIANEKKVSPAWLTFHQGPRDPLVAAFGFELAKKLEKDPRLAQALSAFEAADEEGKKTFELLAKRFASAPQEVNITVDHDAIKPSRLTAIELKAKEEAIAYGKEFKLKGMPEPNMKPFNTRAELPRFNMSFKKHRNFTPIKLFRDLAAGYGPGENYVEMEDAFIEGVPRAGHTIAQVRGDSMIKTLHNGDFVLLKDFPPPYGYELPQIESSKEKTPLDEWKAMTRINDGDIVAVEILGQPEGKTLKRVLYDTRRGRDNWKMKIVADNPNEWIPGGWQVDVGDHIRFYGLLMGLCETV